MRVLQWFLCASLLAACGGTPPAADASADVAVDTSVDASADVTRADVAADATADVAADATADVAADATADVAADATADVAADATADIAADATADVATDDVRLVNGCPVLEAPVARMGDPPMGDTFAGFARSFFQSNCTRCHATTRRTPKERNGAPDGMNWDDEASVRRELARIRRAVGVDNYMPLAPATVPCADRRRLVRWIDLGAP